MPSLMTRAPPAHTGACRQSSGSNRVPSRSIHWWVRSTCASTSPPGRSVARAIPARMSPGLALRGCVMSSISTLTGFVSRSSQRRMNGSTSSSTSRPLRRRRRRKRRQARAHGRRARRVATRRSVRRRRRRARPATRPRSPLLATPAPAPRAGTAPVTAMPSGNASVSDTDSGSSSTSSANTRSRYSASLSCPVDSANPKLTFGRGEKPSVNASGSWVIRNARSSARATSRCEIQRTLPALRVPQPHRIRRAAPHVRHLHRCGAATGFGPEEADRHARRRRARGPGPCPGCRPRARAARPPRARGRSRCIPRSRSRESTGNRGARARPGPPASRPRGSRGAGRPRCGPRAAPRRGCGGGSRTSRDRGPRPRIASIQRSSEKCSLHSWKVPPARQTASMTRPIRRSPRLTMPSANVACGSCHFTWALVPRVASRSMRDLAVAARRRCSGRTTGTACAASARTRRPTPCSSPASCSLRPMSTTLFASSAIPSVSSSISVGRPVRK